MGLYKDDNDSEEDFGNSFLNKPGFSQRASDRDITQQMPHLNLYGNQSDSRAGSWNGVGQSFDDQRTATWNGGQSFDAPGSQASLNNPFSSSSLHSSDPSADLWSRGSSNQPVGGLPAYNSFQMSQNPRVQSSTAQFSRSFSQPQSGSVIDRFSNLTGSGIPPISTGFQHSSSPTSGQTSPGRSSLLSMGSRPAPGQLTSSISAQSQNQSLLNNSMSKSMRPGGGLPSSLSSGSKSSPNLLPLGSSQAQQQQQISQQQQPLNTSQQQQPQRVNSFGNLNNLSSSNNNFGFGPSRSLSTGNPGGLLSHLQSVSSVQPISSIPPSIGTGMPGGSSDIQPQQSNTGISSFDLDFPALANRGAPGSSASPSSSQNSSLPSRTGYGGALQNHEFESFVMVTGKNQEAGSEFQIQNEDFPALPGSSQTDTPGSQQEPKSNVYPELLFSSGSYESIVKDGRPLIDKKSRTLGSSGIQTSSSGVITNIPVGMVTDQFGMIGLLTFIRAAETEPNLVTLALGSDLTTLGLNLNSTESLYHTFGSPFSDTTCRPHEIDYHVPPEYLVNTSIRDRLAPIRLSRYCEDLLFYLFTRDWRYHKEERVWITRAPGMDPQLKTSTYERGTYYCFDQQNWRKVAKEFHVEYDKLEDKPTLGLQQQQHQQLA
eukprot:gene12716-14021_t